MMLSRLRCAIPEKAGRTRMLWLSALLASACSCNRPESERGPKADVARPTGAAAPDVAEALSSPSRKREPKAEHGIVLTDITNQSGIDFRHSYDGHGELYIVEAVAGGLATLDYDGDGRIDICFPNGASIPLEAGQPTSDALYRNLGQMRFQDVTLASRSGDLRFSMGAGVGDFDNDGFPDLFVNNFGPNHLYHNNGDGTFSDVTDTAGIRGGERVGAGACFLDADRDGALDLYVGNYVKDPVEKNIKRTTEGYPTYPGPLDFQGENDFYFHNEGDGRFSDQTDRAGLADIATTTMGVIAADYDDDGDDDIFVANDVDRNLLLNNDGTGRFEEVGIERGVAFSYEGKRNGNMGVACADFDGDGGLDFFTTNFSNELPVLYRNDGSGFFSDATIETNAGAGLLPHANWGVSFFDVENDGDSDLIVANGHTDPNIGHLAYTTRWKVANSLLRNVGGGRFEDISRSCGSGLEPVESSRGLAVEDFDNDGDGDVIVLNALAPVTLMRNDTRPGHNWLQLELRGRTSPRDGTGTKVNVITADGHRIVDEVHSGSGYQSSYGQRLSFGLGNSTSVSMLIIRWSDGSTQQHENLPANQLLTLVQTSAKGRDR